MTELLPFLKDLISAPGISGYEGPAARIIADRWRPLVDELKRDSLGSLRGLQRGTSEEPRPSVMIATHMDSIGLMVTGIKDGFLRTTQVGGVDARPLPGTPVTVFATGTRGRDKNSNGSLPLPGVVALPYARLLPQEEGEAAVPLEHLFIDTGLLPREVSERVRVGDVIAFAQPPVDLSGETLSGHSLDNRASVAALTVCLEELKSRPHSWDVWAVASSQEEVGGGGAAGSTFDLHPTMALVVDVTFAKGPGTSDWNAYPLGKGPTITMGPNMHPALHTAMKELADRLEIPYAVEYVPTRSGTDGMLTQVTAEGIPTLVIGIPLRYMHTPVEVVAIKDILRAGRLLAGFIAGLGPDFTEKIVWDK